MAARFRKFIAAKAAETSVGRELIKGLLGDHGEKMAAFMHGFNVSNVGKKDADQLEEQLFKLISKVIVLIKNNKLKYSDFTPLVNPTRKLCWTMVDAVEMTSFSYDSKQLADLFSNVSNGLQNLIKPHITGDSIERLQALQAYWSKKDTLDKFVQETSNPHKLDFADELTAILEELQAKRDAVEDDDNKDSKEKKSNGK